MDNQGDNDYVRKVSLEYADLVLSYRATGKPITREQLRNYIADAHERGYTHHAMSTSSWKGIN